MLNDFSREYLDSLLNDSGSHTKEEYYDALLNITEYYLNELLSSVSTQEGLADILGEERADEVIQEICEKESIKIAKYGADVESEDQLTRIKSLFDYVRDEYGEQMGNSDDFEGLEGFDF